MHKVMGLTNIDELKRCSDTIGSYRIIEVVKKYQMKYKFG